MKPIHPEAEALAKFILERPHYDAATAISEFREASTYDPSDDICPGWCKEDVHSACQDYGYDLSDDDAVKVLERVAKRFDANNGIDWDTIWIHIQDLQSEGQIVLFSYEGEDEE